MESFDPTTLRVLVVDSKSASRKHVEQLLRQCSYQVTGVQTAKEALELLSTGDVEFDLVLKDHGPPAANACRLLGTFAQSPTLRRIPVVVMSSQDARDAVLRCLHLGAADYLVKPLRINELRNIWTRVWWHRVIHAPSNSAALGPVPTGAGLALSVSGSDATNIEDDDEPTSKEGSASGGAQRLKHGPGSANRNSTTKPGGGHVLNADGSNTANGHGSNNANGASTTHVYASNGGTGGMNGGSGENPLIYSARNGSGEGSGSGNSRDRGDGSGQGSGSGNEDLAAQRRLPSDSPEMRAAAAAGNANAAHASQRRSSDIGNGSNNHSGVGNSQPEAGNAKREQLEQAATAQGKRMAEPMPQPAAAARASAAEATLPPKPTQKGSAAPADGSVGFRAWVSPQMEEGRGIKRSASVAASQLLPPPAARSVKPKTDVSPRGAATPDRLGSATGTGTGGTGASDGTHFGGSAGQGSTPLGRTSSAIPTFRAGPQPATSVLPPSSCASQQGPIETAAAMRQVPTSAQASQPTAPTSQQLQQPTNPHANGAWANSDAAAAAIQMQQLQVAAAAAQQQQQQAAQQQQQSQQSQQMSARMHNAYKASAFPYGGMPPHMVPPNFPPMAYGHWGSYAAAAAVQQQQQQQQSAAVQSQGGDSSVTSMQQQMAFPFGQQALQQQQLMMAGYPAYLMNSFGMGGMAGGFPNFQAGWAQAQAQAQLQAHAAAHMQQAGGLSPQGPTKPCATNGATVNGTAANGKAVNGNGMHHASSVPQRMASLAAAAANDSPAVTNGGPRAATPTAAVGDSGAVGDTLEDDSCGGKQHTQRERRAQALTKYKQKRKNLCFTKKIRYESRKQLAQARPRVKGQFVRVTSTGEQLLEPSALAAALEAGEALVDEQGQIVAVADGIKGIAMATNGVADDDAMSDASDMHSPRATAAAAASAPEPPVRQTRSQSGKGQAAGKGTAAAARAAGRASGSGSNFPIERRVAAAAGAC